jgi:hypothetical protein
MPLRKSHAEAKVDDDGVPIPKSKHAPEIQWAKNPDWTFILIEYLGDNVGFHLKLFSDSTADTARENKPKLTAKESKSQQYCQQEIYVCKYTLCQGRLSGLEVHEVCVY